MQTPIYSLTETEAVNRILSTVGGEKVADLTSLSLTADSAYTQLRDSLRDLQSHPWGFNTQKDVELQANGHGQIRLDVQNFLTTDPSSFSTASGWNISAIEKGIDGTPGPLGYGIAHHWGRHSSKAINSYALYQFSDALGNALQDETYYTLSVYMKYHSAAETKVEFWDQSDPTRETDLSFKVFWNTDGTVSSTTIVNTGEEAGVAGGDTTAPPQMAASYQDIGNGWIRVIQTFKITGGHDTNGAYRWEVRPNNRADGQDDSGTEFGSSYMWGPMLTKGAYVEAYNMGAPDEYGSMISAIDLAPENAGNLDVVLRHDSNMQDDYEPSSGVPDNMLFDRTSNSFNAFSGKYKANITYYLQFEDCPEVVKQYATALAAANFQAAQVGNPQMDAILRGHAMAAKANFESYEASQESWSIFENYDVWKLLSPFNRPGLGGDTRSSWASSLG